MFGTGVAGKALPTPKHTRPWISAAFHLPSVAEQNPVIYGAPRGSFPPLTRKVTKQDCCLSPLCACRVQRSWEGAWGPDVPGRGETRARPPREPCSSTDL